MKLLQSKNKVEITLSAENIGKRDGKTVIQVYASAEGDNTVKLLKGFKKVFLKSGETKIVSLKISKDDLRFYDPKTKTWYLEDGYSFFVGQNCEATEKASIE